MEFALCGVPMLFAWISVIEMARGMWYYHTLQFAVKTAGDYVAVHGAGCATSPNSCTVQISDIATKLKTAAIGIPDSMINVTFTSASGSTQTCNPLTACYSNATQWPPTANGDNAVAKDFKIRADMTFRSALSMVTPQGSVAFGTFDFPGYTHQLIRF